MSYYLNYRHIVCHRCFLITRMYNNFRNISYKRTIGNVKLQLASNYTNSCRLKNSTPSVIHAMCRCKNMSRSNQRATTEMLITVRPPQRNLQSIYYQINISSLSFTYLIGKFTLFCQPPTHNPIVGNSTFN